MAASEEVKAAFAEIEQKFQWDVKITKWMVAEDGLGATSIDDFLYAISAPEDINKIVTAASPANVLLMTSRVRQAWLSIKKSKEDSEGLKRKGLDDPEMEAMLPQEELEDMGKNH